YNNTHEFTEIPWVSPSDERVITMGRIDPDTRQYRVDPPPKKRRKGPPRWIVVVTVTVLLLAWGAGFALNATISDNITSAADEVKSDFVTPTMTSSARDSSSEPAVDHETSDDVLVTAEPTPTEM